jgi:uncharacterized protein (UPF0335 family)
MRHITLDNAPPPLPAPPPRTHNQAPVAKDMLKSLVERIERLEEERGERSKDIRDMYLEAMGKGFDTKILRKVLALRKRDHHEREEEQAMIEVYCQALDMQLGLPFGEGA